MKFAMERKREKEEKKKKKGEKEEEEADCSLAGEFNNNRFHS